MHSADDLAAVAGALNARPRKALGWKMPGSTRRCNRFRMGLQRSADAKQHVAHAYHAGLQVHGILCSMSQKGDPLNNALMGSFLATLKGELVDAADYQKRDDARAEVFP